MNTLLRGPILITTTQTLDLSKYGIQVGDPLNVICIGGGGGGGHNEDSSHGGAAGQNGTTPSAAYGGIPGIGGKGYGAGGGGGAGYDSLAGGGGGSGYIAMKTILLKSTSVSITIGAGGAANTNGGNTSFGNYLTANGGKKGGNLYSPNGLTNYAGKGGNGGNIGSSGSGENGGDGADGFVITGTFGSVETCTQYLSNNNGNGCVAIWY